MGMREQHRVDIFGVEGEIAIALEGFLAPPLEQPALEQHLFSVDFQ